jgi:thiol-disulfide isomerase/thioredoxin
MIFLKDLIAMTSLGTRVAAASGLLVLLATFMLVTAAGCPRTGGSQDPLVAADSPSAAKLLVQLVDKYQQLSSYEDAGELHVTIQEQNGQSGESPPIAFSVAFERPTRIRIHVLGASVVADGKQLRASADSLADQVLVQPCPKRLDFDTLFSDPMLLDATHGQLGVAMPQLALLLQSDPLKTLAADGEATKLDDAELQDEKCHRVAVNGPQGTSVFWIAAKDGLLRKFEFPADAFKKKLDLAKCSIWADFKGARGNTPIASAAFQFAVPEGAKLLNRFLPPPPTPASPLLDKAPDDFSFVDFDGAPVTRDSLQGKIVVLDMWATWCQWCFKGFPNLEQIYEKYKDNDKVTILAVNQDEPAVSDAQVRTSFSSAQLSIPIVRDTQQQGTKVFRVEVLPTMIIMGADGTVQEYNVGYDPLLAESLPRKIEKLLAGENLAKATIEAHERAQKEYDERLQEALVDDTAKAATTDRSEDARQGGSTH